MSLIQCPKSWASGTFSLPGSTCIGREVWWRQEERDSQHKLLPVHVARDKRFTSNMACLSFMYFKVQSPGPEKTYFITCMLPAGTLIVTGIVLSALCIYSPDSSDCIFSTVLYIVLSDLLVSWLFCLLFSNKLSGLLETINTRNRFPSMTDCRNKCTITNRWQSLLYLQLYRKGEGASSSVSSISASALSFAISNSDWSSIHNLLTNH